MKPKTKRQIKLEDLHKRLFTGMAEREIKDTVPKIPVTLFKRASDGNIGASINSCPICGKKHLHHWDIQPTKEYRVAHCEIVNYLTYPLQYELFLDWNYAKNARFKEQYLQQVEDYKRNPEEFNKLATQRQRIYHQKKEAKREEKLMYGYW